MRDEEMTAETIKKQMTDEEWQKVYEMSLDKSLYTNLCTSLFPTIHGMISYIMLFLVWLLCVVLWLKWNVCCIFLFFPL